MLTYIASPKFRQAFTFSLTRSLELSCPCRLANFHDKVFSPSRLAVIVLFIIPFVFAPTAHCREARLAWDKNNESDVAGYRLFCREELQSYDYTNPAWEGKDTGCSLAHLDEETTYCFVVRAFDTSGNESTDSNEVCQRASEASSPSAAASPSPSEASSPSAEVYTPPPGAANLPPQQPIIVTPDHGQLEWDRSQLIVTEPISDPDGDSHGKSRWQISERGDPSSLVLDVNSDQRLSELPVPVMVLKEGATYYVRVQHYDAYGEGSGWSEWTEFTTASNNNDLNGDGIPDDQEVNYGVDLNGDDIDDLMQPELIKCVRASDGFTDIGVCKVSESISAIEELEMIAPEQASQESGPGSVLFGLIAYRIQVNQPGDAATVRIHFSEEISAANHFYKYDSVSGWQDYSQYCIFNEDNRSITIDLKDGDYGDADGVANGVIVDPGALIMESPGSSGYCFIAGVSDPGLKPQGRSIFGLLLGGFLLGCLVWRIHQS